MAELLEQCGWMSVHQLAVYHSMVLVFKVIQSKSPKYLHLMFTAKYNINTKQAKKEHLQQTKGYHLEISQDSFRWRSAELYNEIPLEIRNNSRLETFKKEIKSWIKTNVSINPD